SLLQLAAQMHQSSLELPDANPLQDIREEIRTLAGQLCDWEEKYTVDVALDQKARREMDARIKRLEAQIAQLVDTVGVEVKCTAPPPVKSVNSGFRDVVNGINFLLGRTAHT